MEQEHYEASIVAGILDSLVSHVGRIAIEISNASMVLSDTYRESVTQEYNNRFGGLFGEVEFEPAPRIATNALDNYLETQAATVWDMNCYHAGRCGGDVVLTVAELYTLAKGIVGIAGAAKKAWSRIAGEAVGYGGVGALAGGGTRGGGGLVINREVVRVVALEAVVEGVAEGAAAAPAIMAPHSIKDFRANLSKIDGNGLAGGQSDSGVYVTPNGGGGVTSTIKVNGQTITFGHGGRHLEGTRLNVNSVNQALANEVSRLNIGVGQFHKGRIVVDGITIEYTSYGVSEGVINIGTYYPK